jgi:tetrahydromethanopterin S-methyltransferase subunit B
MSQLNEESIKELNNTLNELKVNTHTIVIKMDQIYDSIEKLEKTVETISAAVSTQEKRLTVLEQSTPKNLIEDLALLKNSQQTYNKILWVIATGVAMSLVQSIFKVIH